MAPSTILARFSYGLVLVIVVSVLHVSRCEAQNISSIVDKAILCFNNTAIYRNCQEQFRLTTSGTLNVPGNAVDAFCSGPCLAETQLLLRCIDGILSNFQFYNGATTRAVNATILVACGSGIGRGNFNINGIGTPAMSPKSSASAPGPAPPPASHGGSHLKPFIRTLGMWAMGSLVFMVI